MSDRLTSSPSSSQPAWTLLAYPLILLLVSIALIPLQMTDDSYQFPLSLGQSVFMVSPQAFAFLILCAQSGLLIRCLLPLKSPAALKAFAAVCGTAIPFVFLQGFIPFFANPFLNFAGAALMVFSWILLIYANNKTLVWSVGSGLCSGLACSIAPICFSGLFALLFYRLLQSGTPLKKKLIGTSLWIGSALCGLIPALNGSIPFPLYQPDAFSVEFLQAALNFLWRNTPLWTWFFMALGLGVGVLQKQKIILTLLLPFFILRILFSGLLPLEFRGIESTILLPLAWLTAYGFLRLVRGIEQGVRNASPQKAKAIPLFATASFIVGFCIKIADIYGVFA